MNVKRLPITLFLIFGSLSFGQAPLPGSAVHAGEMKVRLAVPVEDKNLTFEQVKSALKDVDSISERPDLPSWKTDRVEKFKCFLLSVKLTDRLIDPRFDLAKFPLSNIPPPREANLPSGSAPSAIRDPKLRKEYEDAIASNMRYMKVYSEQNELRRMHESLIEDTLRYASRNFKKDDAKVIQDAFEDAVGKDESFQELKKKIIEGINKK